MGAGEFQKHEIARVGEADIWETKHEIKMTWGERKGQAHQG
jgi:hypothetical protein